MVAPHIESAGEWTRQAMDIGNSALKQLEELTELQLDIARSCADLGALQLRGMTAVRDWNSLQTYLQNQGTVAARFSQRLANDMQAMFQLATRLPTTERH